ncbi:hypothetical protein OBBRIDRAFT_798352 [Obba rivulosa]|uniref:Uncharacterized protein n=1 Tax=Obba rivulosa TaxID=1052685 RepID=A0A8E2AIQ0_9APHY|nr:hypothetical protein OBBRIDRAFT_798352 [Obba rivulosa]
MLTGVSDLPIDSCDRANCRAPTDALSERRKTLPLEVPPKQSCLCCLCDHTDVPQISIRRSARSPLHTLFRETPLALSDVPPISQACVATPGPSRQRRARGKENVAHPYLPTPRTKRHATTRGGTQRDELRTPSADVVAEALEYFNSGSEVLSMALRETESWAL